MLFYQVMLRIYQCNMKQFTSHCVLWWNKNLEWNTWETIISHTGRGSSFMCTAKFLWETGNPEHRQPTEEISVNKVLFHSLRPRWLTLLQPTSLNDPGGALLPLLSYAIFCFSFLFWLQTQWLLPPSGAFRVVHPCLQTARNSATILKMLP